MDSTTKACESGKRNKIKFNPSTYKHARRKHTVMLSRISKISVFGIVALMLVLGLTADDALAQDAAVPAVGTYVVTAEGLDDLRAAGTATVTFTLRVDGREDKDENAVDEPKTPTPARTVTINIPSGRSGWPLNPESLDGLAADTPGEVSFAKDRAIIEGNELAWISGRAGRDLNVKIVEGADGDGVYTIVYAMATVPNRRSDNYAFEIDNADTKVLKFSVDYAESGSGTVTMTPYSPLDAKVGDADHVWKGKYVFNSKTALRPLKFIYKAAGSMPKVQPFQLLWRVDSASMTKNPPHCP